MAHKIKTVEQVIAAVKAQGWPCEQMSPNFVKFTFKIGDRKGSMMYSADSGRGMGRLFSDPRDTEFTTASPFAGIPWFDKLRTVIYGDE